MVKNIEVEWIDYDVVVVGSGGAGAHAARAAAEAGVRVLVVSKDPIGASDTKISEGIATVRDSAGDSDKESTLSENVKMAGGDLPIQKITDAFAQDSVSAYDHYREEGLRPKIAESGDRPQPLPLPLGGHTRRRSVGHENCGVAFGHANWNMIVNGGFNGSIEYMEDAWFLDLAHSRLESGEIAAIGRVHGGLIYHAARGCLIAVRAPAVVIAAGGLSTLYFPKTDTMRGNTGDSYAVAARAGAELVDMEQIQFLPFCLTSPPSYEGLLAGEPVTASFLGVLRDKFGKIILDGVYLRTRAECSSAIMRAVEEGRGSKNGGAYLDMTANMRAPLSGPYFKQFLKTCLPSAFANARQALSKSAARCEEPWEVRPGAHYQMGGIRVDCDGASVGGDGDGFRSQGIQGLFAAGQAMGGLFGANRLGSTSLTEGAVFGRRAGRAAAAWAHSAKRLEVDNVFAPIICQHQSRFGQSGKFVAAVLRTELQELSWLKIGPVKSQRRLDEMDKKLDEWTQKLNDIAIPAVTTWNQAFLNFEELRNMLETAKAISTASRERDGSVGGHVRLDGKNISAFAQPYSTLVHYTANGKWRVRREKRTRAPLKRLIFYKIQEKKRLMEARILRALPAGMRDRNLMRRYQAIMGSRGAPEVSPGSDEAAVGEVFRS